MSGSLNKVQLIGHLGADPAVRSFQNGGQVAELRLATSETWKDKNSGERKSRTEWHSVKIMSDGLVSVAERFLRKGSKVYVEGKLQTRKWQDQSGADRYSTEVILQGPGAVLTMLDGPTGDTRPQEPARQSTGGGDGFGGGWDDLDDDAPFISANPRLERRAS